MRNVRWITAAALLLAVFVSGCDRGGQSGGGRQAQKGAPAPSDSGPPPGQLPQGVTAGQGNEGRTLYRGNCVMCHGEALQSKNVRLDSPESLKQHAQTVYQQVVVMKLMPMNNATGLTETERAMFAKWFEAGAPVE